MSNDALKWAFDSGLPPGPRFVLVVMGDNGSDHSGEDWTCYPSVAKIMGKTGMGRSTVERHLSWLWSEGWISREPRTRKDGTLGINDYVLHKNPEKRAALKAARAGIERKPGRRRTLDMRDGPTLKTRVRNPQNEGQQTLNLRAQEPLLETLIEPSSRAREPGSDGFDEAASHWPRRGQKFTKWPAARAAWAMACQAEPPERVRAAIIACAEDPDRKRGDYGWPGLDRFLIDETWRAYLPAEPGLASRPAQAGPDRRNPRFEGPAELRDEVAAYAGEGFACLNLDRCAWHPAARILTPHSAAAAATLQARVGHLIAKHGAQLAPHGGSR